ncbi:pilin [Snodgrassella alvi]|jgi:type IV pilus assembly protein PilA|uniref:pilin n=1 Tax=Snodgrassella alvi TaxID=1196083 RepID=UPI000C1E7C5D|nr:pilin [Snodgrassella alvi]PIT44970.1 hypothetical protein BHC51_08280 [Snodgrassella alvi]
MKALQKGFTLIELMIVIAIIGILAAIAVPAYSDYIARSQASEASSLAAGLKTQVVDNMQNNQCTSDTVNGGVNTIDQQEGKYGTAVIGGNPVPNQGTLQPNTPTGCTITYTVNTTGVSSSISGQTLVLDVLKNGSVHKNDTSTMQDKYIPKAYL